MRFSLAKTFAKHSFSKSGPSVVRPTFVAVTIAVATLGFTAAPSLADGHRIDVPSKKTTLVSLYREWAAKKDLAAAAKQIKIQPVGTKLRKAAKKVTNAAKKPAADEITDAEILAQSTAEANDPLEPINRLIFGFNEVLDLVILTPVSKTYRFIVPTPLRTGVSNAIANAKAPVTFANDLLQGKPQRAKTTFMRFLINTTVGFGGLVDAAEAGGFEKHTEDFGQTLAVWGLDSGPYMVLPVFGPSTPRHLVGRVADTAATPTTWILADLSLLERSTPTMAELISGREALLDDVQILRESSPDFYASVRDIYRQSRKNAIFDGELEVDVIPDLPIE